MMKKNDKLEQNKVELIEGEMSFEIIELDEGMLGHVVGGVSEMDVSANNNYCPNSNCS